jgi:glutathione synthase/RimK-type ligase-like ATP-grasp enzyme
MHNYWFRKLKLRIGWHLKSNLFIRRLIINYVRKKNNENFKNIVEHINTADKIIIENCKLRIGFVKDQDGLSLSHNSYWPIFERFTKNNNIPYSFINIHCNDWISECKNFDLIVWNPLTNPASLYEQRTKIAYIEKFLKVPCHPNSSELWLYEDKVRQFYHLTANNLPVVPTFISFDEEECISKLDTFKYPLISKSFIGSASLSVSKLNNKAEVKKYIFNAFSNGINTGYPYYKQKGYVYFQEFINDATFDLRIILVGEKILGYYRMVPKNDFRASGAGLIKYNELPLEAVLLAMKVKEAMPSTVLAVDFLASKKSNKYYIIETSIAIDVDCPGELILNGIPGYYLLNNDSLEFHPGKFWLPELLLEELIKNSVSK